MVQKHYPNIIFSAILLAIILPGSILAQPQSAYERGLEELYSGNHTGALEIWYNAYDREGSVDARIGIEYIRVAASNRMRDYYGQATELYYRALLDASGPESRTAIRQEINRLRPIIGRGIYRQWVDWWENEDSRLGADMRGFWVQEDPTPAQVSNERLIEHWIRIAEAKQQFTKNSNTVYGTDDRALLYIRYGNPDRVRSGILTLQSLNVRNWLQNQMNPYAEREGREEAAYDREFSAETQMELFNRLQDAIYEFHRYPEYEIWFYEDLTPQELGETIFIFGTDVETGEFGFRNSVEDFIPERAYQSVMELEEEGVEFTRAGYTPALILQLLYYEQLVQADSYFESRLNDIRDRILEQDRDVYRGLDLAIRTESREILQERRMAAPVNRSTYSERMPRIPLDIYQYRLLDEDGIPFMLTYLESYPQEAFLIDFNRYRDAGDTGLDPVPGSNVLEEYGNYELVHSLIEYDDNWKITTSVDDNPKLIINRPASERIPSRSLFRMNHDERAQRSASVKLMNNDPEDESFFDTPFASEIRGLNHTQFRIPVPLTSHPDSLEMADLVLGYRSENNATEPFSFRVANDGVVPFEETLVLHFEVYNLARMDQDAGFTRFDLTYRILPVEEDGTVRTDQSEFVLTLNFTNEERNVREDLEIETADLSPGLYDLRVQVIDTVTGQRKQRVTRFEVVE
ncbi:MAG: GWxTD domain-containing protein [Balneolaceae bacterium]|nr:GWxTD domain-containing protein [Balneolaceae bacterium]